MATPVDTLHAGDELPAASDAVAEVEHFDGSLTRLDAGAVAQLGRLADPDGRPHVVITLGAGDSWHRTSGESARHGQYEAHTDAAAAMARAATFVVRSRADGTAWFAALAGAVVVRGRAGGTVVLHEGEAVAASAAGLMGDVERLGLARLLHDEWIGLNHALDTAAAEASEGEPTPPPAATPAAPVDAASPPSVDPQADDAELTPEERDHPWRVGVAAVLAIGLGIFSVIIGRSASTPDRPEPKQSPGIAVPGPPSFASPAMATPTSAPAAPAAPAKSAATSTSSAAPRYDVTGRTCTRRNGAVHYTATIRNEDSVARGYTVQVRFVNRAGAQVADTSATVDSVPAGATRTFHATGTGAGLRTATDCEVGTVSVR